MARLNARKCLAWIGLAWNVENWASSYVFKFSKQIGRVLIKADMRRNDGLMGRFGGGWNWKLGFQLGGKTLLISLLLMDISFSILNKEV